MTTENTPMAQAPEDAAFERYEFGPGVTVEGMDGWERSSASKEITRKVYVQFDDDADNTPTHRLNFTVVVDKGIAEAAWASTSNGQQVGRLPAAEEQKSGAKIRP